MFGFSIGEWVLLMAIALIAIGPKQLPEVARTIGRLMGELKRATSDFTRAFTDVRDDARKDFTNPFTASSQTYSQTVRAQPEGTVSSTGEPSSTAAHTVGDGVQESAPKYPITPDDPFGSGHNAHAHEPPPGYEEQGSLFVQADLSTQPSTDSAEPKEEQLAFRLGHDDEGHS